MSKHPAHLPQEIATAIEVYRPELIRNFAATLKATGSTPTPEEYSAVLESLADLLGLVERIEAFRRELRFTIVETGHQAATHFERFVEKLDRFAEPPSCVGCGCALLTEQEVDKDACGPCWCGEFGETMRNRDPVLSVDLLRQAVGTMPLSRPFKHMRKTEMRCTGCGGVLMIEIEVDKGVCVDCHKMQQSKAAGR